MVTINKNILKKFNEVYPIYVQRFNDFTPHEENENFIQRLNNVIEYLNQIGRLNNQVVKRWNDVVLWIANEGLNESVTNAIQDVLKSGVFEEMVQKAIELMEVDLSQFKQDVSALIVEQSNRETQSTNGLFQTEAFQTINDRFLNVEKITDEANQTLSTQIQSQALQFENDLEEASDQFQQKIDLFQGGMDDLQNQVNTQKNLVDQTIYASNYLTGSENEATNLQRMFDDGEGKTIVFPKDALIQLGNTPSVYVRSNTTMVMNGAKFKKSSTGSNYCLVLSGDYIKVDRLEYIPFPSDSEVGVKVTGNYVSIGQFVSTPEAVAVGGDSASRNALFIDGTTKEVKGFTIQKVTISNYKRPFQMRSVLGANVYDLDIRKFVLAVTLRDVKKSVIHSGYIRESSEAIEGNPGENGILMESMVDYGCQDITVRNVITEDSGEHGFRIGGQYIADRITFDGCTSRRAGRGKIAEGGRGHGGCGFKALGSTSSTKRHSNISYLNCTSEDGRTDIDGMRWNWAGFQIGKCVNVRISNPVVTTTGSVSNRSFVNGMEIIGCEEVTIESPNIQKVAHHGMLFYDVDPIAGGGDFGEFQSRINVNGGVISQVGANGVQISPTKYLFRRIKFTGTIFDTADKPCVQTTKSGTGDVTGCSMSGVYFNPNQSSTTMIGMDNWLITGEGVFTATDNNCANGSTFAGVSGAFRLRKAGAWTTL